MINYNSPASNQDSDKVSEAFSEMNADEFRRIVDKFESLSGIRIQDHKRVMVQTRILNRMREIGCENFQAYLTLIESGSSIELTNFCNTLTTNLTSFFREPHHFEHFKNELEGLAKNKRIRVWSAGCSTGEEPYSIAITALSQRDFCNSSDLRILATDLDTDVLVKGVSGVYPVKDIDDFPDELSKDLIDRIDDRKFEIRDEAKKIISFKQLNLLGGWPFKGDFDVIFCRNVLIYFPPNLKDNLISRFVDALRPGGVLYLGHSERIVGKYDQLRSEGNTTYRKLANAK